MSNDWIDAELDQAESNGLLRRLEEANPIVPGQVEIDHRKYIDLSSNDYLCLSMHKGLIEAGKEALERWGCGSRASRLISGNHPLYRELEQELADFKGTEASLVFGSGFLCNLAVLSSILRARDAVFMDRLCHASLVDGALLSRARIYRFRHNDLEHLETLLEDNRSRHERCLIVVESVYSMDGDLAPVSEMCLLAKKHDALLLVDEAHAIGVFGREGEGLVSRENGCETMPDLLIGTFGKALGSYGAFCATSQRLKEFLINRGRPIIYSTALPPAVLAVNLAAIRICKDLYEERKTLLQRAEDLRRFISVTLSQKTTGMSQIVPLILSSVQETLELQRHLRARGFFAKAIRPPTVPKDSPRIRISLNVSHDHQIIERLKDCLLEFF